MPLSREEKARTAQEAYEKHGSHSAAARSLGVAKSTLQEWLHLNDRPPLDPVGEGYYVKGVSTLVGEDGETKAQWIKTSKEAERQAQALQEAVEAAKESIPRAKPEKPPQRTESDLCACYFLADAHLGMLAWGEETRGTDWDTDIAEQTILRWMQAAIESAPKADTGVLAQLGDWLHHDGLDSVTPSSGHVLDADTRFQRLVRVAVRVLRQCIRMMLKRHQHVHVILAEGNHDMASSVWLREIFAALYEDEPRVTIDTSPDPYYCVEWGRSMIGFHHGHIRKAADLSKALVGKFREIFGRTEYHYGHTAHLHSRAVVEDPLMIVEQHPNLPGNDAHSSRGGYGSQDGSHVITYHRQWGEVGRTMIRPEMVQAA